MDPSPYEFRSPNKAQKVPDDVFPGENVILVPDGFLIPGRSLGNAYLMVLDSDNITNVKKTVKIAEYIDDTWYHKGHWVDLNGDGLKDLLIPRANYKRGDGMLVWFENPGESALSDNEPWKEHIISEGPTYESSIDFLP